MFGCLGGVQTYEYLAATTSNLEARAEPNKHQGIRFQQTTKRLSRNGHSEGTAQGVAVDDQTKLRDNIL